MKLIKEMSNIFTDILLLSEELLASLVRISNERMGSLITGHGVMKTMPSNAVLN